MSVIISDKDNTNKFELISNLFKKLTLSTNFGGYWYLPPIISF